MADKSITDKEWLDIAWKHFQQHAQQRIIYFNYFVVFSTILSSGLITTFQNNFQAPYLGICTGIVQIFLSFIFWKIDDRNKFLTQHAENVIKQIETDYNTYSLFNDEDVKTKELKESEKNRFYLFRQISHGKSYRIILIAFCIWGFIGVIISSINSISHSSVNNENQRLVTLITNNENKIDSIKSELKCQEKAFIMSLDDNKNILSKLDSINKLLNIQRNN